MSGSGFSGAPTGSFDFASLCTCHDLTRPRWNLHAARQSARTDAAFPLTLQGRLHTSRIYGAVSILRRVRTSLRPAHFPVYASSMLFRHPIRSMTLHSGASRLFVGNAVAPAIFNGLANIYATLGSYYWLGFVTSGLSPDKKRLALLGAQRQRDVSRC